MSDEITRTCAVCGCYFQTSAKKIAYKCDGCHTKRCRRGVNTPLTAREKQLAALVATGLGNKDIAWELRLTEGTVKIYLSTIFKKFHVHNRTELALKVYQQAHEAA